MPFSIQGLAALAAGSSVTMLLPGGSVRRPEGTIVGPLAQQTLTGLRFDTTILTCCAAAPSVGVTAYDLDAAAVQGALPNASERTT
jgi:DeoR/GlpR family transcriptional regulator of sugar metabolism